MSTNTIVYGDLPEATQQEIDTYPEEQSFSFYARLKSDGSGYEIRAIADRLLDLLAAQGGMDPGWMEVIGGEPDLEEDEEPVYD
jgi:hypothetical protein